MKRRRKRRKEGDKGEKKEKQGKKEKKKKKKKNEGKGKEEILCYNSDLQPMSNKSSRGPVQLKTKKNLRSLQWQCDKSPPGSFGQRETRAAATSKAARPDVHPQRCTLSTASLRGVRASRHSAELAIYTSLHTETRNDSPVFTQQLGELRLLRATLSDVNKSAESCPSHVAFSRSLR